MPSIYMDVFVVELEAYPCERASHDAVAALERAVQEFNDEGALVSVRLDGEWFSQSEIHDAIVEAVRRECPELDAAADNAMAGLRVSYKIDEIKVECE